MITQISYNIIIDRFKAFADGHYLIKGFTHGDPSNVNIEQGVEFPWMHVFPVEVEPRAGSRLYSFIVTFADLPRDKETAPEYQREVLSDCIKLAEDLLSEVQNGLTVFGPTVELDGASNIEVFINEYSHTLTGVNLAITLSVPWDWSACDIPANWSIGGTGSGGSGVGVGLILKVNSVDNVRQDLLNLVQGANVTITDLGDGRVKIDATGDLGTNWGTIGGVLSNQTDLQSALDFKADIASLAAVAFSGDYNDLINLPTIPTLTSELTNDSGFITIGDVPTQVNADWNASSGVAEILNKPTIPAALDDLTDVSTAGEVFKNVLYFNGTQWVPYMLSAVAYSGSYNDLSDKPSIPKTIGDLIGNGVKTGDIIKWNGTTWVVATPSYALAGLSDVDIASAAQGDVLMWNDTNQMWENAQLHAVAYSGDYNDLSNKPTIPAAQIQSDWTQANTSALDYIKNKPTIPSGTVTSVDTAGLISGGPITSSGTITTAMNTAKLVGRYSAGSGIMQEITVGSGLTLTGAGTLNNTATPTPLGYYGQYFDYISQTATTNFVGVPMIFRTPDLSNGISVVSDGTNLTKITFDNTGIYNLQFSTQFQNYANAPHDVFIWLRKNGTTAAADVIGSTGVVGMEARKNPADPYHTIVTWNFLLDVVAGDFYQIIWATSDVANVSIQFYIAQPGYPSTVSTLFTVTQQSGIMAGTGITAINSLTGSAQTLAANTSGSDFNIASSGSTHTFNLPSASATKRGALTSADWTAFNAKVTANSAITPGTNTKITYDAKGLVTAGTSLVAADLPTHTHTASQISDSTTVGQNLVKLTDPSAISYLRVNANNSVSALTLAQLKSDLGLSRAVLSGDISITASNTTLADITGLSFAIIAGNTYKFRAELYVTTSASNTGLKLAVNANVAVTACVYRTISASSVESGQYIHNGIALDSASATNVGSIRSPQYATIEGILIASNNGTAIMRFAKGAANAGTLTIKASSFVEYQTI